MIGSACNSATQEFSAVRSLASSGAEVRPVQVPTGLNGLQLAVTGTTAPPKVTL